VQDAKGGRVVFGDFVDRIFWGLLVAIASFGVVSIQSLSTGVAKLNENMAVVIAKLSYQDKTLDSHEIRIYKLEVKK
jgi:hypothetical protein